MYFGVTVPYGNSQSQIPFSGLILAAASNDERGWRAYELGPGSVSDKTHTYNIGNLKLQPVWNTVSVVPFASRAVFFDTGNVWYTSSKMYSDERGVFSFDARS